MKNHKEMFEALLAGEVLQYVGGQTLFLRNGVVQYCDSSEDVRMLNLETTNWQIKPKTININGFEVPEPIRTALAENANYYIPRIEEIGYVGCIWRGNGKDLIHLNLGIIHTCSNNALLHSEALLSFTQNPKQ